VPGSGSGFRALPKYGLHAGRISSMYLLDLECFITGQRVGGPSGLCWFCFILAMTTNRNTRGVGLWNHCLALALSDIAVIERGYSSMGEASL
jgi:hypothetical protein